MMARSVRFISDCCHGTLRGCDPAAIVSGLSTDSRRISEGDVFFALTGERFDGHRFLGDVARRGAKAMVIAADRASEAVPISDRCFIEVDEPRQALGRFAAEYRKDFQPRMLVVGGSNGKTTLKELLAEVLSQRYRTLRSEASFNNDIGVPLTLSRLDLSHEAAVLEVGTNHPGELAPLLRMIQPHVAVIPSIGREHLEFFGDLDGVIREQSELARALPSDGMLVINGDAPGSESIQAECGGRVVTVGASEKNQWRVKDIRLGRGTAFNLEGPRAGAGGEFAIQLLGEHQALNAAIAAATAVELGLGRDEIAAGLAGACPAPMRMEWSEAGGVLILDDTYNANADSMQAGLRTLAQLACEGRRIAVVGGMAELGVHAEAAHLEMGRAAGEMNIDMVVGVGPLGRLIAQSAKAAGVSDAREVAGTEEAMNLLRSEIRRGDVVLFKASRAERLERIPRELRGYLDRTLEEGN